MSRHHVVLVPGFFGFGNLGELAYFVGVRETLTQRFEELGLAVDVREVPTLPTASIRHRAARVLELVAEIAGADDGPIHLIGHSTGGLDARLAVAPTASLPTDCRFDAYDRLGSLITIATPHFGTPLASFFGSAMGKPLLRILALTTITLLQRGRLPMGLALRLGEVFTKLDDRVGLRGTVLDQLYEGLLSDFSPERRAEMIEFVDGISSDQSLVFQLTPAGCDVLNASTADPDVVRYGSVVTRARKPNRKTLVAHRGNVYAHSMYLVYSGLHFIASRGREKWLAPLTPEQHQALTEMLGEIPSLRESDGIVPSLSQVWGEVIHAVDADHLDVVGHFGRPDPDRADADWLPSDSGFGAEEFDRLWTRVAAFITAEAREAEKPRRRRRRVGSERTEQDANRTGAAEAAE